MRPRARPLLLALALSGCAPIPDRTDGTVVVLVMDGVRAGESLGDGPSEATGEDPSAFLPRVWDEVVPQGARGSDLWNLGTTTTTPAHVDLVGGTRQVFANYALDQGVGLYRPDLPMLPELLSAAGGDDPSRVVLLGNTRFLMPLAASLQPGATDHPVTDLYLTTGDEDDPPTGDEAVLDEVRRILEADQPRLLVANLHGVDRAGHYGEGDAHLDAVRALDDPIADLHEWIRDTPAFADDTWVLLTTDHGRHAHADTDPVWRHHGCSCNGCRHLSFALTGPGVRAGVVLDEPATLEDLGVTLASLLGVDLPFASGLALDGILEDGGATAPRSGVVDVSEAGGHRAEEVLLQGDRRSEIVLDGVPVSSPDAFAAEHPVLASDGERSWLCFREVVLAPTEPDTLWQARCLEEEGGEWADVGAPIEHPGPFWDPVLVPGGDGRVHLVYANNPNGTASGGKDDAHGPVYVDVATWDGEAWAASSFQARVAFPTAPDAVPYGTGILVAVGASPTGMQGRHHRDVYRFLASPADPWRFGAVEPVDLVEALAGGGAWRMEKPALAVDGDRTVHLAAVGVTEAGTVGVLAARAERDEAWGDAQVADLPGPVLAGVAPVWLDDRAFFAGLDGDEAVLCGVAAGGKAACAGTGSPRIRALVRVDDGVEAVVDEGGGAWAALLVAAADLGVGPAVDTADPGAVP